MRTSLREHWGIWNAGTFAACSSFSSYDSRVWNHLQQRRRLYHSARFCWVSTANVSLSNWSVGRTVKSGEWHSEDYPSSNFPLFPEAKSEEQGILSSSWNPELKHIPNHRLSLSSQTHTHTHQFLQCGGVRGLSHTPSLCVVSWAIYQRSSGL